MNEEMKAINTKLFTEIKKASFEVLYALDRATENAAQINRDLLSHVVSENKDTEYGRKYGFGDIQNVDDYRRKVPLTEYADYEPYIDRITATGEQNLLTAAPVIYFAGTSGSTGKSKMIPMTENGLDSFLDYTTMPMTAVISEFYQNTRHTDFDYGKECALLSTSRKTLPCGIDYGCLSAVFMDDEEDEEGEAIEYYETAPKAVMLGSKDADMQYLHARYALAEKDTVYLSGSYIPALVDLMNYIRDHHSLLVRDIREGRIDAGIRLPSDLRKTLEADLAPDPLRADELEAEFARGFDPSIMKRIWPRLAAICTIWAGNFLPYAKKLQRYSGRTLPYYTMSYVASEGVFAVARHPWDPYYIMVPDSCFYEFIPMDQPETADADTLLLDELEEGKEYELVITNQSGFYRYRMGDVIRVIGYYNETPMIEFRYRKKNILSLAGEKVTEADLLSAVEALEHRCGLRFRDFCVFPDHSESQGRYVVFMEPEAPVPAERVSEYEAVLEEELCRASTTYGILAAHIGRPRIVFLKQDTFRIFRDSRVRMNNISENQIKTIRVLSTPETVAFFESRKE